MPAICLNRRMDVLQVLLPLRAQHMADKTPPASRRYPSINAEDRAGRARPRTLKASSSWLAACSSAVRSRTRSSRFLVELANLLFGLLALDRIADRPRQHAPIQVNFRDVVLRPLLHHLQGQGFISEPGEHDNGNGGSLRLCLVECFSALAVGKRKVQKNCVDPSTR